MKYGHVDVARFRILKLDNQAIRTYMNGEDITDKCRWADDETGTAEVFVLRDGKPYINGRIEDYHFTAGVYLPEGTCELAIEILHGSVEFI